MVIRFLLSLLLILEITPVFADQTKRWDEAGVYFPEQVVLVHGINTTNATWNTAKPQLEKYYSHYWKGDGQGPPNTYVHAVNYGGLRGDESFQPIEISARKLRDFINIE